MDLWEARVVQALQVEGSSPGEQLEQQDAEAVDVASRVDIERVGLGLLRGHVRGRAQDLAEAGDDRSVR